MIDERCAIRCYLTVQVSIKINFPEHNEVTKIKTSQDPVSQP